MNIREAREKAGLTRKQVSDLLEIPYRTLTNWELGTRQVPDYVERLVVKEINRIGDKQKQGTLIN